MLRAFVPGLALGRPLRAASQRAFQLRSFMTTTAGFRKGAQTNLVGGDTGNLAGPLSSDALSSSRTAAPAVLKTQELDSPEMVEDAVSKDVSSANNIKTEICNRARRSPALLLEPSILKVYATCDDMMRDPTEQRIKDFIGAYTELYEKLRADWSTLHAKARVRFELCCPPGPFKTRCEEAKCLGFTEVLSKYEDRFVHRPLVQADITFDKPVVVAGDSGCGKTELMWASTGATRPVLFYFLASEFAVMNPVTDKEEKAAQATKLTNDIISKMKTLLQDPQELSPSESQVRIVIDEVGTTPYLARVFLRAEDRLRQAVESHFQVQRKAVAMMVIGTGLNEATVGSLPSSYKTIRPADATMEKYQKAVREAVEAASKDVCHSVKAATIQLCGNARFAALLCQEVRASSVPWLNSSNHLSACLRICAARFFELNGFSTLDWPMQRCYLGIACFLSKLNNEADIPSAINGEFVQELIARYGCIEDHAAATTVPGDNPKSRTKHDTRLQPAVFVHETSPRFTMSEPYRQLLRLCVADSFVDKPPAVNTGAGLEESMLHYLLYSLELSRSLKIPFYQELWGDQGDGDVAARGTVPDTCTRIKVFRIRNRLEIFSKSELARYECFKDSAAACTVILNGPKAPSADLMVRVPTVKGTSSSWFLISVKDIAGHINSDKLVRDLSYVVGKRKVYVSKNLVKRHTPAATMSENEAKQHNAWIDATYPLVYYKTKTTGISAKSNRLEPPVWLKRVDPPNTKGPLDRSSGVNEDLLDPFGTRHEDVGPVTVMLAPQRRN